MDSLDKRDALLSSSVVLSAWFCFHSVIPLPTWLLVLSRFFFAVGWNGRAEKTTRHGMLELPTTSNQPSCRFSLECQ